MSNPCLTFCLGLVVAAVAGCAESNAPQAGSLRGAVHLLLDGNPEEALEVCDVILDESPEHFEAHMLRGEISETLQNLNAADCSYRRALELEPKSKRAQMCLNRLHPSKNSDEPPLDQTLDVFTPEVLAVLNSEPIGDSGSEYEVADDLDASSVTAEPWQPNGFEPSASDHLQMLKAIAEARRLDELAREEAIVAEVDEVTTSLDSQAAPKQVTRFDLSVGGAIPPNQGSAAPTTGHGYGVSQLPSPQKARSLSSSMFQNPPTRNWAAAARRAAGRC